MNPCIRSPKVWERLFLGQQSSIPKHHGVLTLVLDAHQWRKVCWALSTCAVSCRQRAFRPLGASERPFQTRKKITVEPYCLAASRGWVGIWVEGAGGYMGGVRGWVWVWVWARAKGRPSRSHCVISSSGKQAFQSVAAPDTDLGRQCTDGWLAWSSWPDHGSTMPYCLGCAFQSFNLILSACKRLQAPSLTHQDAFSCLYARLTRHLCQQA